METRKFVCKYCCKRFPCGKSLGGHIRTHMSEGRSNNAAADSDTLIKLDGGRKKRDLWSEAGGGGGKNSSIYGLRENPKKTIRFVHSDDAAATILEQEKEERFCKECGKGFSSLKALCGHMACHSEKDKKEKLVVMDSQSDTETNTTCAAPIRRSKRMMRFKSLSSSSVNVSEVEQEQEEVAMCLMLLSKDSFGHRNRFASESSDNNSVVLETKSSSLDTKIAIRHNGNNNFVEKKKLVKDTKLKSSVGVGVSNNSDYFRYGSMEDRSGFEDYNCELNGGNRSKHTVTVFKKLRVKNLDHDRTDEIYENGRKGWEHGWLVSERDNGCYDSTTDDENSSESDSFPAPRSHHTSKAVNNRKNKSSKAKKKKKKKLKSKKSREHECPICYKIFRSGQALGGHKRSHFVGGGSEENTTLVIKQGGVPPPPPPPVPCLIDLNLPAPVDE